MKNINTFKSFLIKESTDIKKLAKELLENSDFRRETGWETTDLDNFVSQFNEADIVEMHNEMKPYMQSKIVKESRGPEYMMSRRSIENEFVNFMDDTFKNDIDPESEDFFAFALPDGRVSIDYTALKGEGALQNAVQNAIVKFNTDNNTNFVLVDQNVHQSTQTYYNNPKTNESAELIVEKLGSSFFKGWSKEELDKIRYTGIDLNRLKDADIVKVADPRTLLKKPYYDSKADKAEWLVIVMGEYEKDIPYKEYEKLREIDPSAKRTITVRGPLYYWKSNSYGQEVDNISGPWADNGYRGRGRNGRTLRSSPKRYKRKDLIDGQYGKPLEFYLISLLSKQAGPIRDARYSARRIKTGDTSFETGNPKDVKKGYYDGNTWKDRSQREIENLTVAKSNRDRYAKAIKNNTDFSDVFEIFKNKMTLAHKAQLLAMEEIREKMLNGETKMSYHQAEQEAFKDTYVDEKTIENAKKHMYGIKDKMSKVEFLKKIYEDIVKLVQESGSKEKLKTLKALIEVLKNV